jgi:hypothetical protein
MAVLNRDGDDLVLTLSTLEKAESLHGDIRAPLAAVRGVEVLDDAIHAVHGLKLPGARWPGKIAVGTFVGRHRKKTFAVVHHDTPRGLRVRLEGAAFDELLVGCDDPEAVQRRLDAPS